MDTIEVNLDTLPVLRHPEQHGDKGMGVHTMVLFHLIRIGWIS